MKHQACNNSGFRALLWLCAGLWIYLIWQFSAQPGTQSELSSGGISARLARLLFGAPTEREFFFIEHLVRKIAHLTEFALLGLLLFHALEADGAPRPAMRALLGVALVAATDEFHQLAVPGRSGMLSDVAIDCAGGLIGLLLLLLLRRLPGRSAGDDPASNLP